MTSRSKLVLLEHLNFKVPYPTSERLIKDFFVQTLGCPECPPGRMKVTAPVRGPIPEGEAKQMHVNLGLSQIHFEWCTGDGRPYSNPQRLEGHVTLAVADLEELKLRLTGSKLVLAQSRDVLSLEDPFGLTTWNCVAASPALRTNLAQYGSVRPGGVGNVLGMIEVSFACRPGISHGIANFYRRAFQAETVLLSDGKSHGVKTVLGQLIKFNESPEAPPPNGYDVNGELWGVHMCFYVGEYEAHCRDLVRAFWVNPDYKIPPINDNVTTIEAALERKQFRLKRFAPESEFVLEHEIRAIDHPLSPLRFSSAL